MAVCRGKEAVKAKGDWWQANHEVHGATVEGPYVNGDQFVVRFTMEVTPKATGERVTMDEVGTTLPRSKTERSSRNASAIWRPDASVYLPGPRASM